MVHLKRTAITPLCPFGPPTVVIPRVSYQDAPSDLRRYVRHDAVERHYGSARQEEADEENERLDAESDEEYGHNLSRDHDEDYEGDEEGVVADEAKELDQVQLYDARDIEGGNTRQKQKQEQPQPAQQQQEGPHWAGKAKSSYRDIIVAESPMSPDAELEEPQQQPSPAIQLTRTKAYKHGRRKGSLSEETVVNSASASSSTRSGDVEMEDVQEIPEQKAEAKFKLRRKATAKRIGIAEKEYDVEHTEEKPKAKPGKKALLLKTGYICEEDDVYPVPPALKRKAGWSMGKKRGASIPRPIASEDKVEDVTVGLKGRAQAEPKSRRNAVSKAVIEDCDPHDEIAGPQQKPKLRQKAPTSKNKVEPEDDDSDEPPRKPRRKVRKTDAPDTRGPNSTFENEELAYESTKRLGHSMLPQPDESEGYSTRKPKSRGGASTRGRGGGAAARAPENIAGKTARTTASRQTAMRKRRGPSILQGEMARHGVESKREEDELMIR